MSVPKYKLLDALFRKDSGLNPSETLVAIAILNRVSSSFQPVVKLIAEDTKFHPKSINRILPSLVEKGVVGVDGAGPATKYFIRWEGLLSSTDGRQSEDENGGESSTYDSGSSTYDSGSSTEGSRIVNRGRPKHLKPSKELSKQTPKKRARRQREDRLEEFESFWGIYPRKVAKLKALKAWRGKSGTIPPMADLERILSAWKSSSQWSKDGGQFIPHPATWLNNERWNDDLPNNNTKRDGSTNNNTGRRSRNEGTANDNEENLKSLGPR